MSNDYIKKPDYQKSIFERDVKIENLSFERDELRLVLKALVSNVVSVRAGWAVIPSSIIHKAEELLETNDDVLSSDTDD